MKKNKLFVIVCLLSFLSSAHATGDDCSQYPEVNEFAKSLFDPGCLDENEDSKRCDCLEKARESHFLISAMDKNENIKKYILEQRAKRTQYFWKVYTQMTHGAALQKQMFFSEESPAQADQKVVGCPPTELSRQYAENLENHAVKIKSKRDAAYLEIMGELKNCLAAKRDCGFLKNQLDQLEAEKKISKDKEVDQIVVQTQMSNQTSDAHAELKRAREWYESRAMNEKERAAQLKRVDCYTYKLDATLNNEAFSNYEQHGCKEITGELKFSNGHSGAIVPIKQFKFQSVRHAAIDAAICGEVCAEIKDFTSAINVEKEKIKSKNAKAYGAYAGTAAAAGGEFIQIKECTTELCKSFENSNNSALNALQENFQQDPNNCITYPQFLLGQGIPGIEFMKELAGASPEKMDELLTVPKVLKTKADKERLKFLQSNPLVAKLASAPNTNNKQKMAEALQKFTKDIDKKSYPNRLSDYFDFMKNTVKDLLKKEDFKSQEQYICHRMINSYTAIQVATDLPLKLDPNGFPLSNAIRECKILTNNAVSQTSTVDALEMDDLFREVEDLTGDEPEKSEVERFQELNKRRCQGYSDFLKTCAKNKEIESCRQDFLSKTKDGQDEREVFDKWGTSTSPRSVNFNTVANASRASYQDEDFKSWWDKKIGSKMSKDSLPYKGEEAEYSYDQKLNESKLSETEVPASFKNKEFTSAAAPSSQLQPATPLQPQPQLNPGQIVPTYSAPIFDPSKLVPGQSVTRAITNFDELPPIQKIEGLQEVEDYIKEKKAAFEEFDLKEKLAEAKEKIAEEKALQEELEEKLEKKLSQQKTFQSATPSFSSAVNQVNQPTHASTGGSSAGTASTFGKANGLSNTSAGHGAVNEALKTKEASIERSPGSTNSAVDLTIKHGVVAAEELKGKLEIQTELTAASSAEFISITQSATSLEKYLEAHLQGKDLGAGKIISIINPGTESPVQHLIFRVNVEDGKYVIQSMPANVKIQRSSTLDRLKLNLKQFSKKST